MVNFFSPLEVLMLYKINTEFKKYTDLDSVKEIVTELSNLKDEISILDLSLNTFSPPVLSEIAAVIQKMKNLKHIILESILDTLTFEEMTEVLTSLSTVLPVDLQAFELPSNAVSCSFPLDFGLFLEKTPLRVLNLHNCGLGEDGLVKVAQHLKMLENKSELESLDLSKNRINVICAEFDDVVSEFNNLRRLILNANTIEEKSMSRFLQKIENEKLEVVNLGDNFVCGEAISGLVRVFEKNRMKELYLQDVKADEGDILHFLQGIRSINYEYPGAYEMEKSELILDISCNGFEQDAVLELEGLTEYYKFKSLIIFDNDYEDVKNLRELVASEGGVLIDEEEEEIMGVDVDLLQKLSGL